MALSQSTQRGYTSTRGEGINNQPVTKPVQSSWGNLKSNYIESGLKSVRWPTGEEFTIEKGEAAISELVQVCLLQGHTVC